MNADRTEEVAKMVEGHLLQADGFTSSESSNTLNLLTITISVLHTNNETIPISETEVNRGH